MEHQFTITSLNQLINAPFTVRQIKIENPTSFNVFLNLSTQTPNNLSSEYTVQPNSVVITPAVTCLNLNVVVGGLNLSKSVVKITIFDSASQQAAILPYQTTQFVGNFPNYPYTLTPTTPPGSALPTITLDRFQTVYFMVEAAQQAGSLDTPITIGVLGSPNGLSVLGAVSQGGGVIPYSPSVVPNVVTPVIYYPVTQLANRRIGVIQTSDPIDTSYYGLPVRVPVPGNGSAPTEAVFAVNPPYAIVSIEVPLSTPFITPFNAFVDIDYLAFNGTTSESINFFTASYNFALTVQQFLVKPKLFLVSQVGYFVVRVGSNTAVAMNDVTIRVYT